MKNKLHDHTLTKCLKVLVFALVILMPFFIWVPTGLYYGFNEHANATTDITTPMITAWTTIWSNNMFSWVNNTAIYTVLNNTTTLLEINSNSCIPQYLTYIFLLTIIYVIVDIILWGFTYITHIFNKDFR